MTEIVRLPVPASTGADEHADRTQRLFDWAADMFKRLGLDQAVGTGDIDDGIAQHRARFGEHQIRRSFSPPFRRCCPHLRKSIFGRSLPRIARDNVIRISVTNCPVVSADYG
jgi:hypothetical protein